MSIEVSSQPCCQKEQMKSFHSTKWIKPKKKCVAGLVDYCDCLTGKSTVESDRHEKSFVFFLLFIVTENDRRALIDSIFVVKRLS
jgi:hypothetical protein